MTVFATQMPCRKVGRTEWEPLYDISPAEAFGVVTLMLPPGNLGKAPDKLSDAIQTLQSQLQDFDPETDHILPLGDPVANAIVFILLGRQSSSPVSVLKFDRRNNEYTSYLVSFDGLN